MTTIVDLTYKSFEGKPSSKGKLSSRLLLSQVPLGLGFGSWVRVTDLSDIGATEVATQYYAEQIREKIVFDAREKENGEFWEAVYNFTSYSDWYTGDPDLATSVWKDKCRENSLLENDCTHGKDCQRKNKCNCTSKWEVEQNEKTQEEQYQLDHNLKRKSKRQKRTEVTRY